VLDPEGRNGLQPGFFLPYSGGEGIPCIFRSGPVLSCDELAVGHIRRTEVLFHVIYAKLPVAIANFDEDL
jgi:hypothetical protein